MLSPHHCTEKVPITYAKGYNQYNGTTMPPLQDCIKSFWYRRGPPVPTLAFATLKNFSLGGGGVEIRGTALSKKMDELYHEAQVGRTGPSSSITRQPPWKQHSLVEYGHCWVRWWTLPAQLSDWFLQGQKWVPSPHKTPGPSCVPSVGTSPVPPSSLHGENKGNQIEAVVLVTLSVIRGSFS